MEETKFSKNLAEMLEIKNMKAIELARASGIPKQSISRYLAGKQNPGAINISKMAKSLGCNVEFLTEAREEQLMKKLNNRTINTIQDYLCAMEWAQNIDYKAEQLNVYLRAIHDIYLICSKLVKEKVSSYEYTYRVDFWTHEDEYNCWSKRIELGSVYSNRVETTVKG